MASQHPPTPRTSRPTDASSAPWLPPRWFIRTAWAVHRAILRLSGGRLGLRQPRAGHWGMLRLTTLGRRSGKERVAVLGYFEDGPDLVTMAMNGWGEGDPAWWLNLQAQPEAWVELKGEARPVRGRAAEGDERSRLWAKWPDYGDDPDAYAARRKTETAIVVLEPRVAT